MKRYIFRVYTEDDPNDGFSVWEDATSESEARMEVMHSYHSIREIYLISVENVD